MKNDLRQQLHLEPQSGWLNDPNGLCFFKGRYHVYFQYAPGSADGSGKKCWGHFQSRDLISWEFTGTCENFAQMFTQMSDPYMQARAADVKDISNRLIACMDEDICTIDSGTYKMIVIADDLSPSETVVLDKDRVLAFVTAGGSPNSHTAILARNMNIPAVIGVGDEILQKVRDGQTVVVDGSTGEIIVQPDEEAIAQARAKQQEDIRRKEQLRQLIGKPDITLDGRKVNVYANIGGTDEIDAVLANDAGGIGLFRSEFLYLGASDYPCEEEQFRVTGACLKVCTAKRSSSGRWT